MTESTGAFNRLSKLLPTLAAADQTLEIERKVTKPVVPRPPDARPDFDPQPRSSLKIKVKVTRDHFRTVDAIFRYPPPETMTADGAVFPHVVVGRPGWPWECCGDTDKTLDTPWLALLVTASKDRPAAPSVGVIGDLFKPAKANVMGYPRVIRDIDHEKEADACRYLDLDSALIDLLPSAQEAAALCHIQYTDDGGGAEANGQAVILAPRTLQAVVKADTRLGSGPVWIGVYLVGLESYWTNGERTPAPGKSLRLPVFQHWAFRFDSGATVDEAKFTGMAERALADAGMVGAGLINHAEILPSGHCRIAGGTSYYRGPFLPGARATASTTMGDQPDPVLSAGKTDITYAAAWELGRLLTVHHKDLASALYHWRIDRRKPNASKDPPSKVVEHLGQLARLSEVPLHYLFPHPDLYPADGSIRFFHLDREWIAALVSGALAVGRHSGADRAADEAIWKGQIVPRLDVLKAPTVTGILLRSPLVAAWPEIDVVLTGAKVLHRFEPVTDLLVVLCRGEPTRVELRSPDSALHFAANNGGDRPKPGITSIDHAAERAARHASVRLDLGGTAT
ncbi:MAG: hypothetical protein Q8L23_11440 [Caulobacter sp.]|nr:hypothetical protein [Caulobacter sp.]